MPSADRAELTARLITYGGPRPSCRCRRYDHHGDRVWPVSVRMSPLVIPPKAHPGKRRGGPWGTGAVLSMCQAVSRGKPWPSRMWGDCPNDLADHTRQSAATGLYQHPSSAACGSQQAQDHRLALTYMYSCGPPPACQFGLTPPLPVRGGPIWALPIQTSVSPQPMCHSSRPGVVAYH